MNRFIILSFFIYSFLNPSILFSDTVAKENNPAKKTAILIDVKAAIGPAIVDYIVDNLEKAEKENAELFIIRLDTPGGLDTSMRDINKAILSSTIPVVTYVAPQGARAASAGTYILYASHIAAMAPGTNVGAASPVNIGMNENTEENKESKTNVSENKMRQDASAYIRSLALMHHRNEVWAEKAVTNAESITASEALKLNVIDLIANNVDDLLKQINGRRVELEDKTIILSTDNLNLNEVSQDWRNKFLSIITDPNIAYILMLIGIWGLFFEFTSPGMFAPGVFGAISLLLALYAFQLLPINYTGFGLLLLGILFMILEVFNPTFGALAIGGAIAFIVGSIFLLQSNAPGYSIAWSVIAAMTLLTVAFFSFFITLVIRSQRRKVVTGNNVLLGSDAVVISTENDFILVRIKGEIWKAVSKDKLKVGQLVTVKNISGLILNVEEKGVTK